MGVKRGVPAYPTWSIHSQQPLFRDDEDDADDAPSTKVLSELVRCQFLTESVVNCQLYERVGRRRID